MNELELFNKENKMPEGEPTFDPRMKQESTEVVHKIELSPEQEQVLEQKREQLLQADELCWRFVYHKEYQDLVEKGEMVNTKECVVERLDNLHYLAPNIGAPFVSREFPYKKPGKFHGPWSEAADSMTNWHRSSQALATEAFLFEDYREIYKKCLSQGLGRTEARAMFVDQIKDKVSKFMFGIYVDLLPGDLRPLMESPTDVKIQSAVDLLSNPNEAISDRDRARLQELMRKNPTDFDKSDLRFLMRYSKGFRFRVMSDLPYGALELWSSDVASGRGFLPAFKLIPKGTKTDKLIAIVAISPSDKEFLGEIAEQMVSATKDNPQSAHLIIDVGLFEFYPQRGTDFLPKKQKDI